MKIELSNKEVIITEQRRVIIGLQSQVMEIDGSYRSLQVSYCNLQRNFAFVVDSQGREVEKISTARDSAFSQLLALESSLHASKSKRIEDVKKLIDRNEDLTTANANVNYRIALLKRHVKDWKVAFLELEIYSRGLESLLQVRGFYRVDMPERPNPMFDVTVKQELGKDLLDLEI